MTLRACSMHQPTPLPLSKLWQWGRDILRGQAFQRQHGAVHRDHAPSAGAMARDGRMVICDIVYALLLPVNLQVALGTQAKRGDITAARLVPEVHMV